MRLVLRLFEFRVEEVNVVRNPVAIEELVELLVVDAMRSLNLAVQMWHPRRMYTFRMSRSSRRPVVVGGDVAVWRGELPRAPRDVRLVVIGPRRRRCAGVRGLPCDPDRAPISFVR